MMKSEWVVRVTWQGSQAFEYIIESALSHSSFGFSIEINSRLLVARSRSQKQEERKQ